MGKSVSGEPWQRLEPVAAEDVHFLVCHAVTSGGEAVAACAGQLSPFTKYIVQVGDQLQLCLLSETQLRAHRLHTLGTGADYMSM